MALSKEQQQTARFVYQLAVGRGVSPAHARELASNALAESGLNPHATNSSSGAGGLFQLLSSGYVNTAKRLGGVYDPKANELAILPSYQKYWKTHPNAAPGDAGRDVERSGEGSGFYSRGLGQLGFLGGTGEPVSAPVSAPEGVPQLGARPVGPTPMQRRQFALTIAAQPHLRTDTLLQAIQALNTPAPASPLEALGHAVRTSEAAPAQRSPVAGGAPAPGGKGSLGWLEHYTSPYGLTETSTTGGKHATHSYHYQGRAEDVAGDPAKMAALARDAVQHPQDFVEMFYTGPGHPGFFIKNGKLIPLGQLDKGLYAEHTNHVHVAR